MSYRGTVEKLSDNLIRSILKVAAEDVFLTEAAKNDDSPKCFKAKELLGNPDYNAERFANLAIVHDQNLTGDSPDSQYRKAIEDVLDILVKQVTNA